VGRVRLARNRARPDAVRLKADTTGKSTPYEPQEISCPSCVLRDFVMSRRSNEHERPSGRTLCLKVRLEVDSTGVRLRPQPLVDDERQRTDEEQRVERRVDDFVEPQDHLD